MFIADRIITKMCGFRGGNLDFRQRTLNEEVGCTGIGLHSGEKIRINIKPASPDTGIRFVRTDVAGCPVVDVRFDNVFDTTLATTIGLNGCKVSTVEHLLAAFFGLGVDNAVVEVKGPEVPIMDGSAAPFIYLIKSVGFCEQDRDKRFIVIKRPFKVDDGNRSVAIYPSKELKISYMIDFHKFYIHIGFLNFTICYYFIVRKSALI